MMQFVKFGTCRFFILISIVSITKQLGPKIGSVSGRFIFYPYYGSNCLVDIGKCVNRRNKLLCDNIECQKEEILKLPANSEPETKFSRLSGSSTTLPLACTAQNANGMIVWIKSVIYKTPKQLHFCKNSCPRSQKVGECSQRKCTAAHFASCEYSPPEDVLSKLRSACWKTPAKCDISVPRLMLKNYDTCVQSDTDKEVDCSDPTKANHCYAREADVDYECHYHSMYQLTQLLQIHFSASYCQLN